MGVIFNGGMGVGNNKNLSANTSAVRSTPQAKKTSNDIADVEVCRERE